MEIVVQGTKNGRNTFTPNKVGGLLDVTPDTSKTSAIGGEAYGIRFVENNVIFSKYKIIRDVRGDKRTGFIAFSLFLTFNEKLSGKDIISLLDEVSSEYFQRYIPDNDNNLNDVRENWDFVNRISDKYNREMSKISIDDVENLNSGTKDDGFIYYKGEEELGNYFNVPYQQEYCDFRQVLFIKEELQHRDENPLNALRHSGINLSGEIDLENPEYRLLFNQNAKDGVRIDIKVHGSARYNKNKIRKKEILEITWSKLYYKTVIQNGKWHELNSKYVRIDDNQQSVSIEEFELIPIEKFIKLDIRDRSGASVNDVQITCQSKQDIKFLINNQINFKGEDLGKSWTLSAKKGENLFSEKYLINFERDCPNDIVTISLKLKERKKVVFVGILNGSQISDLKITIGHKGINEGPPKAEFINEEINKTYNVTATYQKGGEKFSGQKSFSPKYDNTVYLDLEKVIIEKYRIDEGEQGIKKQNCPGYSNSKTGDDVKDFIKPERGWKFTGFKWEGNSGKNDHDGILIAQYKRNHKPFIITASILSVLIISAGTWWFWPEEKMQNSFLDESTIKSYVEGIELNNDTLDEYKAKWETQNTRKKNESTGDWYNPLTWKVFNQTDEPIIDPNWKKASGWIDDAIKKRNSIDNWDFVKLKDSTKYSNNQLKFKNAIKKVDSVQYDTIQKRFKNMSAWNLNQIADSINKFQKLNEIEGGDLKKESAETKVTEGGKSESPENKHTPGNSKKNNSQLKVETRTEKPKDNQTESKTKTSEVKRDLQSGTITKNQLEEYKKENNADVKMSIELYLQFWGLVNSNQKSDFDKLLKKVNKDNTLKNSELKELLNSISKNSEAFQKYSNAPGKALLKTVNEIKNKIK